MSGKQFSEIQTKRNGTLFACTPAFLLILLLGTFYSTTLSMVATWSRSETYTHGFLILPIVTWLVWRKRTLFYQLPAEPYFIAVIPLLLSGIAWMLGYLVDVLVVQQFALIGMIVFSFMLVMGLPLFKAFLFPLLFLFFAVPAGEALVPALMEYTATVTVMLVKLTGIPVYRDGMFISLPSGNWSVVEACSGVRYLISSVTIGCLFAYLNYSSTQKRLIFIIASAIVPIIANGLRAYMIVMLGHLSNMELAVGVDHLIYGWVFFGLVMLILFYIGSKWRDPELDKPTLPLGEIRSAGVGHQVPLRPHFFAAILLLFVAIGLWPAWVYALDKFHTSRNYIAIPLLQEVEGWVLEDEYHWEWQPVQVGADHEINRFYSFGSIDLDDAGTSQLVSLHLAQYFEQKQGAEVVGWQNTLFNQSTPKWAVTKTHKKTILIETQKFHLISTLVKGPQQNLLVWKWFRVGHFSTENAYLAKFRELESRLFTGRRDAAIFVIATPLGIGDTEDEVKLASARLKNFVANVIPKYEKSLDIAVSNGNNY